MTAERRRRVLELLRDGDFITGIADAVGVRRQTLYLAKQKDEAFAKAWDEAQAIDHQVQLSATEEEMDFRGRIGWLEPKFYEGRICGFVRKYSDGLLLARMKALAPEQYGDRAEHKHSGSVGIDGSVTITQADQHLQNLDRLPLDDQRQVLEIIQRAREQHESS